MPIALSIVLLCCSTEQQAKRGHLPQPLTTQKTSLSEAVRPAFSGVLYLQAVQRLHAQKGKGLQPNNTPAGSAVDIAFCQFQRNPVQGPAGLPANQNDLILESLFVLSVFGLRNVKRIQASRNSSSAGSGQPSQAWRSGLIPVFQRFEQGPSCAMSAR